MSRLFTIRARDADDPSKALPSGMALEDVEAFSEIYKNIATCGTNIDPEGMEFREGVKLSSYFCRMGSMRFFITRDEDTRGSILDRLFTDFVLKANFDEERRINELSDLHRDIDCELLLNSAGRRLVEGRGKRQQ